MRQLMNYRAVIYVRFLPSPDAPLLPGGSVLTAIPAQSIDLCIILKIYHIEVTKKSADSSRPQFCTFQVLT
jgi:hypothetical protein